MQLKESSFINILGRLDEDTWEDATTHEKKSMMVVILDEVEYCSSGGSKQQKDTAENSTAQPDVPAPPADADAPAETASNFTGYEPFGGGNSFFDEYDK